MYYIQLEHTNFALYTYVRKKVLNYSSTPKHLFLTLSSSSRLRAANTNFTPCLANAIAVCSPIPLDAPVMKTTLPFSRPKKVLW